MYPDKTKMESLAEATNLAEVKGRSLWTDARVRFMRNKAAVAGLLILTAILLFALFGSFFQAWTHEAIDWKLMGRVAQIGGPSLENGHYFGADELGRDLYARVVQGTGISIMVGVVGSLVAVIVGTLYGATAGFFGGRIDNIMMRTVDVLMSIPFMFVLILMLVIWGRSITMLFVGIGLISWLDMARIVRGQTLTIKNKEFVEAAIAVGVSPFTIILRHIVPNLLGIVVVYATLLIPGLIMAESFISFLGLGVQEPMTSLGALIQGGSKQMLYGAWWQIAFPLFFFLATLFAFTFVGDGLRDALDPKDR